MHTRRHPRTLNEAFGPYADRSPIIEPKDSDYPLAWWLMVGACAACGIIAVIWG